MKLEMNIYSSQIKRDQILFNMFNTLTCPCLIYIHGYEARTNTVEILCCNSSVSLLLFFRRQNTLFFILNFVYLPPYSVT